MSNINENEMLLQRFYILKNRKWMSDSMFEGVQIPYTVVGVCGCVMNLFIGFLILLRKKLRTERNILILNLAFADLWLACFTVPLTLADIKYIWGTSEGWDETGKCRLKTAVTSIPVFVSTISITSIAFER